MSTITTLNFRGYKGSASYSCTCGTCGKTLKRTVTVEHTVNPMNKNEDGSVKTAAEVSASAYAAARAQAAEKEGSVETCRDCDEAPMKALLLEMAAAPDKVFPRPDPYWSSPMHYLADRKQVAEVHERCECKSECCSGWKRSPGFKVTPAGIKRAAKFKDAA